VLVIIVKLPITYLRGMFKKFPHFYIFTGNGEGGRSSNWSCL